ncbi:MAG: ATP-binding cassette domain-containing protein [Lachnospiraceae bacterium]|jgi:oligopeptide/dipeptide ABC transporter ATP-binding protein|nr:ATP-binding cassette domain-containing protein [Lachnospiraceae bacterium]MCI9099894.1 ATP-binding cassette domain-containing protein [Lachnospiraceae bacterium]MCI9358097.1 ATP-binding cassette domain-containing protein [Lachnospiraceae bacterium]
MFDEKDMILDAKHVTRRFPASNNRTLVACSDVSLRMYKGKTLGLVGESGCGKSTFMRFLVSLDTPTEGEIFFHGKDITKMKGEKLRQNRQKIQMVFQDPSGSFNPKMKIRDIICEPLINFKRIKKSEKDAVAKRYLEMVDLPAEFADRYPHNMSGGQRQRIAIARAIVLEPEIVVMDEATCALDVSVQKTIIELVVKLQKEKNIAIGFIAHDLGLIQSFAHQIAVMYLGNIVEVLPAEGLDKNAVHPYTKALMGAIFDINMDFSKKIESIESEAPSPLDVPKGCPFQDRCEHCIDICRREPPVLRELGLGHEVSCHVFGKRGGKV